ncbi:MAG: DUF4097 family beta strand repeat-containing protein [Acidobacteriota bacterium]|nr:DUF4097 family beta strand repeat-containing protein [Acidobacteriota bacterium]
MRPRGSITGPLIIILLGIVFLVHAISPAFPLIDWVGLYWPYLLIAWGAIALLEVTYRTFRGGPIPTNGISVGAWFVIVLICLVGFGSFELRDRDMWWQHTDWSRGFDNAFGEQHEFSVRTVQKSVGTAPHIVIESFRGDAKITGTDGTELTLGGHKTVRASKDETADRADAETPVEVIAEGKNVIIRCNQNRAPYRTAVTTNLDITVPKGASVEINGTSGDLEVSSLTGDVALRSGNAGVRLQDLGGNLMIDTRRSDLVRCSNVKGTVDLRGHGSDVELDRIGGQVTINGDYTGTVSLHQLSKPVSVKNTRTDMEMASIPGEVRLDRGSLNIQNAVGPVKVNAHSTDVSVEGISNAVEISVDRGDVDLKPQRVPLGSIAVHAGSGNIELALPLAAKFVLTATTGHGQVENDYGDGLREQTSGRGARLEGSVGSGPNVDLTTGRGSITVRKSGDTPQTAVASIAN